MKAQRIFAAIAVTALTASVAVGLTACGGAKKLGKTTLNISDYIAEENTAGYYETKTPELKTLITVKADEVVSESNGLIVLNKGDDEEPSYTVYSIEYEKNIVTGAKAVPQISSTGGVGWYTISYANDDDTYTYKYITLDGKEILTVNDYVARSDYSFEYYYEIDRNTGYFYVDGEEERSQVITFTVDRYEREDEYDYFGTKTDTKTYYFRSVTDDKTGKVSYEVLNASQLSLYGSEYEVGATYNGATRYVYDDSDYPVEGAMKDYKISYFGDTYTFYNGATETGSIEIKNGGVLTALDSYLYYYELQVVDHDSKDYNYYESDEDTKYEYSLYRYDILKDKTKKINCNVAVFNMKAMYNYSAKSFDAAVLSGCEMVDGLATYGMNSVSYVVDKNLKIAFDLHGVRVDVDDIVELGDGLYYSDGYIFDGKLNVINACGNGGLHSDEKLIRFSTNGRYGFTDYEGKIVIEPKYLSAGSGISFYGGAAYVYEVQPDGSRKEALLKPDGTVTYVEDLEKTTSKDTTKIFAQMDGCYGISTVVGGASASRTIELYTNAGTLLKKFTVTENNSFEPVSDTVLKEINAAAGTCTYYKLG